jgi:ParB family chromosome partitioning protein
MMAGKRINLSELADEPTLDARVPSFTAASPRSAKVPQIAANPLNTRDIRPGQAKIESIAESMRTHGQLQPCAVVSRSAFLRIFPEHERSVSGALYVQVTGARRRAAAMLAGFDSLDIIVRNDLAESRSKFVSATAAENIDREDYDPIEEARAVQLLVGEAGSGAAAAKELTRTPAWVTQRLNLLKLVPEVQDAVRSGEVPLRDVRDLHRLPAAEQVSTLTAWRKLAAKPAALTAVNAADKGGSSATSKPSQSRTSPHAATVRRLGGTPPKLADALASVLTTDQLRDLVDLLSKRL